MTELSDEIIARFLSSGCTDDELAELRQWISQSPDNAKTVFGLEEIDTLLRGQLNSETDKALTQKAHARLNRRINIDRAVVAEPVRKCAGWKWVVAVAAVLAIIATLAAPLLMPRHTAMMRIAAFDTPLDTVLPDGSQVWLNKHSSIEFPEAFAENRLVNLDGEAYFEVKHDSIHPFKVDGRYINVSVLGTKFTFRSSNGNAYSFVSLIEGSVKVNETEGEQCVILHPGQKAVFDPAQHLISVNDSETPLDAVWHDNKIPFQNATIVQITDALEQLYDVKIHLKGNANSGATYSGTALRFESIDTTLSKLSNTLPITYTIKGGEVWITVNK